MEPREQTLGDILAEALAYNRKEVKPLIEIVLHAPRGIGGSMGWDSQSRARGLIQNIKALRDATRINANDVMGLTEAKAAIERIRDRGEVTIRMTPERYGYFMVNRHGLTDYNWQVKSSRFYMPPAPETVITI